MTKTRKIVWGASHDEYQEFKVDDIPFILVSSNFHAYETDKDRIVILKSKQFIDAEQAMFDRLSPKTILEFGLFEGGSAILWHLLYDAMVVGIDLRPRPKAIDFWLDKLNIRKDVNLYYGESQDNEVFIRQIMKKHFGGDKIDLIIDDASHMYELSRRSFEITFSELRNGGIYCLEDWGWAHFPGKQWQEDRFWREHKALTNLVFELLMLHASGTGAFQSLYVLPFAAFCYSNGRLPGPQVSLDKLIKKQERNFIPI